MIKSKQNFKLLLIDSVLTIVFFSSFRAQGQTVDVKNETYLVDYVNPLMGTDTGWLRFSCHCLTLFTQSIVYCIFGEFSTKSL